MNFFGNQLPAYSDSKLSEGIEAKFGNKITCSQETKPMGIVGPLALSKDKLGDELVSPSLYSTTKLIVYPYPLKESREKPVTQK